MSIKRRDKSMSFRARLATAFFTIVVGVTPTLAQSQDIPEDLLALDHQRCMNGCVPGFGEATCKPLCDCTVGEFKKKLTFESYLDMSVQLSRNTLTPELRTFLDTVANYCTAELDRQGIQVGDGGSTPPASENQPEQP